MTAPKHAYTLLALLVAAMLLGIFAGWHWGGAMLGVAWIGELFLDALKMLILPLLVSAVISGIGAMGGIRSFERFGAATLAYYLATTALAVGIGLVMVNLIRPGAGLHFAAAGLPERIAQKGAMGFTDIVHSLVSPNLLSAALEMQFLPIIVFSALFAVAAGALGEKGRPVFAFFDAVNLAMMKLVMWLMYAAPLGIFSLIATRIGTAGGGEQVAAEIEAVGWHVLTVLSGLAVHWLLLTLILIFIARRGLDYIAGMARALFIAFGTASSSATLPVTLECADEMGVDRRASRFVIPLGSTVNMDGTALYEAAAAMFIAQAYGIEIGLGGQFLIFITATLASIGAAGIPEAGLVTMVLVLQSVGLPLEGIGLLLSVDWLLDRFRTTVNVGGDAVAAAVLERMLPDEQPDMRR